MNLTSQPMTNQNLQCAAAHQEDPRNCVGVADAVIVVDQVEAKATGCVLHAAVALASLEEGRVRAGSQPGAATAAYKLAGELPPDAWRGDEARKRAIELHNWHVKVKDGKTLCRHDDYDGQGAHWLAPDQTCVCADVEIGRRAERLGDEEADMCPGCGWSKFAEENLCADCRGDDQDEYEEHVIDGVVTNDPCDWTDRA